MSSEADIIAYTIDAPESKLDAVLATVPSDDHECEAISVIFRSEFDAARAHREIVAPKEFECCETVEEEPKALQFVHAIDQLVAVPILLEILERNQSIPKTYAGKIGSYISNRIKAHTLG